LRPDSVLPLVNASLAYARSGQNDLAEASLRQALDLEPTNAAACFNLGLVLAEKGQKSEAEAALRTALKSNPQLPEAAYNLGVLLADDRLPEAVTLLQQARQFGPQDPKYAFTLAYFLNQQGDLTGALTVLNQQVQLKTANPDVYFLLGELYESSGQPAKARQVYEQAFSDYRLPPAARPRFGAKL
jgi:Flp pilus assembly protein TadD